VCQQLDSTLDVLAASLHRTHPWKVVLQRRGLQMSTWYLCQRSHLLLVVKHCTQSSQVVLQRCGLQLSTQYVCQHLDLFELLCAAHGPTRLCCSAVACK
jgi:hypothetical protein